MLEVFPILAFCRAVEAPVPASESPKVAILHPSLALLWMSPPCPSPQRFEDGGVDMDKGCLGVCVSVIVRPSLYFGVEQGYQSVGRCLLMSFDRFSDILQERFHVLFRRASKQEPVILPDILSEKVETVRDVRYRGFGIVSKPVQKLVGRLTLFQGILQVLSHRKAT